MVQQFLFMTLLGFACLTADQFAFAKNPKSSKTLRAPATLTDEEQELLDSESQPTPNSASDSPARPARLFHEVLDELLGEFAYDLKSGRLGGIRNLSIRKVSVNETLPRSYQSYIEILVNERLRDYGKLKVISCIPCKTKNTRIVDDKLLVTSAATNTEEMTRAAAQLGIENFMDIVLVYHSTHMILAFQIFDTSNKELTWTKTYNSETLKSRYQKQAVDFNQIEKSRSGDEYVPEFRYLFGIGGGSIPNVTSSAKEKSVMSLQLRAMEKFDNRRNEFGLQVKLYIASIKLLSEYPSEGVSSGSESTTTSSSQSLRPRPFSSSMVFSALYAHNFLGSVESYDQIRHGLHTGLGLHLASGYIAPTVLGGWDMFLGRRFVITSSILLVSNANILLKGKFVKVAGGTGADLAVSYNF